MKLHMMFATKGIGNNLFVSLITYKVKVAYNQPFQNPS